MASKAKYLMMPWPDPMAGKPPSDAIQTPSLNNVPRGMRLMTIISEPSAFLILSVIWLVSANMLAMPNEVVAM